METVIIPKDNLFNNFLGLIDGASNVYYNIEKNKIANDYLEAQNDAALVNLAKDNTTPQTNTTETNAIIINNVIRYSVVGIIVITLGIGIKKILK